MEETKKPKTLKAFKRGEGIEEQVLFDDEFNWDVVYDESSARSHEKAAELDRIELDKMSLDESARTRPDESGSGAPSADGAGPSEFDADGAKTERPKRTILFMAVAGVALLASVGGGYVAYHKLFPKQTVEAPTAHTYTASIRLWEEGPLELEPFVIPTRVSQKRKFVLIHVFLSVNPSLKDRLEARLPEVRNMIFESLKTAWAERTPRLKVQQLIDSINRMVDAPVVQKLVYEERQEDQGGDSPVARSSE
ncbi:MAG: hypothetical protein HY788_01570 [Deltaproteobacteria bacterium]|nr:hypothetical protein [Deltaproteobacteria bacterium]